MKVENPALTGPTQEMASELSNNTLADIRPTNGKSEAALLPLVPLCPHPNMGQPLWPTMGSAAFYGLPGAVVNAIDPHTEADRSAILLTYLAAFGTAVGREPHALADGARHAGNLFVVLVGETSKARKGTSWKQVCRIFAATDSSFTDERIRGGFGSGEALVDSVAQGDDRRLFVYEPEWVRILAVGRRDGSTLSPLMRQAWDGDKLQIRTRSAGNVVADGAHIAVLGHVTVEELRTKLVETEVANGYANRHLFVVVRRSKLLPSGGALQNSIVVDLGRKTHQMLESCRSVGLISRTDDAEQYWSDLYYQMADDDPGGLLGAVIARDAAQVLRLSVIYALCDGAPDSKIHLRHLKAAWAVWEYCRQSATYIFSQSTDNSLADKLLASLRKAGQNGLDARQMDRSVGGHATSAEIRTALGVLERRGLITTYSENTGGRPRLLAVTTQPAEQAEKAEKGLRQ